MSFTRSIEEDSRHQENERDEEDPEVTKFYTNPIAKPIPHTPQGKQTVSMHDTIAELNVRNVLRNGLEASSEEVSLGEDSLQDEREEELDNQQPPHPAGEFRLNFAHCAHCLTRCRKWQCGLEVCHLVQLR